MSFPSDKRNLKTTKNISEKTWQHLIKYASFESLVNSQVLFAFDLDK